MLHPKRTEYKMKHMNKISLFLLLLTLLTSCNRQTTSKNENQNVSKIDTKKVVGGGCEGCELMYVGMSEQILPEDTSLG